MRPVIAPDRTIDSDGDIPFDRACQTGVAFRELAQKLPDCLGFYFNGLVALIFEYAGERQGAAIFADGALGPAGATIGAAIGGVLVAIEPDYGLFKIFVVAASVAVVVPVVGVRELGAVGPA